MVEVILNLPEDFRWINKNKDSLKFIEQAIINRLSEVRIGNLLSQMSAFKETDIYVFDHLIKRSLYEKIKAEQ